MTRSRQFFFILVMGLALFCVIGLAWKSGTRTPLAALQAKIKHVPESSTTRSNEKASNCSKDAPKGQVVRSAASPETLALARDLEDQTRELQCRDIIRAMMKETSSPVAMFRRILAGDHVWNREHSVSDYAIQFLVLVDNGEIELPNGERGEILSLLSTVVRGNEYSAACRTEAFDRSLRWAKSEEEVQAAAKLLHEERDPRILSAWIKAMTGTYDKPSEALRSSAQRLVLELSAILLERGNEAAVAYEALRGIARIDPDPTHARMLFWDFCSRTNDPKMISDVLWLRSFLKAEPAADVPRLLEYSRSPDKQQQQLALSQLCLYASSPGVEEILREKLLGTDVESQKAVLVGVQTALALQALNPENRAVLKRLLQPVRGIETHRDVKLLLDRVWTSLGE